MRADPSILFKEPRSPADTKGWLFYFPRGHPEKKSQHSSEVRKPRPFTLCGLFSVTVTKGKINTKDPGSPNRWLPSASKVKTKHHPSTFQRCSPLKGFPGHPHKWPLVSLRGWVRLLFYFTDAGTQVQSFKTTVFCPRGQRCFFPTVLHHLGVCLWW